jgi:hypothetical protein
MRHPNPPLSCGHLKRQSPAPDRMFLGRNESSGAASMVSPLLAILDPLCDERCPREGWGFLRVSPVGGHRHQEVASVGRTRQWQ